MASSKGAATFAKTKGTPKWRRQPSKTYKVNKPWAKPDKRGAGSNASKSRIRDIERRLRLAEQRDESGKKTALPSDVLVGYQKELAALRHELAHKAAETRRQRNMSKYKMVKFFEVKKSLRHVKAARKALAESPDDAALKEALHVAEVDHNYASNCPLEWPYVSLYPNGDKGEKDDKADGRRRKGDADMWDRVEKAMADGTLAALKNELTIVEYGGRDDSSKRNEAAEEDSDDGFFD